jgi:hypothetical protein
MSVLAAHQRLGWHSRSTGEPPIQPLRHCLELSVEAAAREWAGIGAAEMAVPPENGMNGTGSSRPRWIHK